MVLSATRPPQWHPATGADLHRLADQAKLRAVEIWELREATEDGEAVTTGYVATSARDYGVAYRVDLMCGCDCQGYARHLRCSHHAALLAHLGQLPDPEDPGPCGPTAALPTPGQEAGDDRRETLALALAKAEDEYGHAERAAEQMQRYGGTDTGWGMVTRIDQQIRQLRAELQASEQHSLYNEWGDVVYEPQAPAA